MTEKGRRTVSFEKVEITVIGKGIEVIVKVEDERKTVVL